MNFSLKTFLITVFLLGEVAAMSALALPSCNENFVKENSETAVEPTLRPTVTITFTIARRRDCLGFGICKWDASVTIERNSSATGIMYVDPASRNRLIIEINKNSGITAECYDKFFKAGVFLMEDESPVPGEYLKELGLSGSKTILSGKHPVTERNGILYVSVPIK